MPAEKPLDMRGTVGRLIGDMREHRLALLVSIVLGIGSVVLVVLGPKLLGNATNLVFGAVLGRDLPAGVSREETIEALRAAGETTRADMLAQVPFTPGEGLDTQALMTTLAWVLAVYVGSSLLSWLQSRIIAIVVQQTMYRLRRDVSAKLGRLPLSYFDSTSRGDVLSRVTNDIDNLSQSLSQTLAQLVTSVFTVVGVLFMMFLISPVLAAVALVAVPLSAVVTAMIAKRSQPQFIKQWRTTGDLNGHIEEMYTGHALVKAYGQSASAQETFDRRNEDLYGSSFRAQFISGTIQPAMGIIGNLTYVVIAVLGGLRVASGTMSLGDVQAFIQYSRQFTQPITQIASMMNMLQSGTASAERVYALLDAAEQEPDPVAEAVTDVRGRVEFDDVSFSYEADRPLIEHLSLVAEPGQTVAIVGPTGAGKTTLVNLIMRFYEIQGGTISLDGVDTSAMTREDLRSKIGMVLQDAWLFEGTIAQNICYPLQTSATGEVTPQMREQMLRAAEATHVDAIVRSLPQGYDTVLSDEGTSLSQGERQLLTIARAFVADPPILILDEATSSVDTRTEVLVQKAMNALREGRTSFVIAHRLSTITGADVIVVMEEGRIVEQGSHTALLEAGGAYARLYESQFAAPAV
ncbi:multidrug ABC transporter ATP-binding protein [Serinibacter arcticus]|uniref:Fatty acid ABC transporter ATP-binding/permease protein n=2 Tax=Serinibacter arcticus TaxID=1655435 RepID=A0A2U1ZZ49_9MICO|nr:ABC transporter ATP-binding protein [Serinibacter arcticus]PWD52268.1 multidrug ABC transporter ATP-binding protein [Serinibacter arcticus]